jgi:hypothetical protein
MASTSSSCPAATLITKSWAVVGQGQAAAVKAVERDDCGQREPLTAVDERAAEGSSAAASVSMSR